MRVEGFGDKVRPAVCQNTRTSNNSLSLSPSLLSASPAHGRVDAAAVRVGAGHGGHQCRAAGGEALVSVSMMVWDDERRE